MTYTEYQNLYEEYEKCDSIKRCEEIESDIFNIAKSLLHKLTQTYAKFGKRFVDDDDYRENRGHLSLVRAYLSDSGLTKVYLNYWDTWCRGGVCDFDIPIPMKYLDGANIEELESDLRTKRVVELERNIETISKQISSLNESKAKQIKELEALKGNIIGNQ